ncbi:MAG: tandem-95 repeat protein [Thermoplasmatota archaeon]
MVSLGGRFVQLSIMLLLLAGSASVLVHYQASGQEPLVVDPKDDPPLPPWGYYKGILPNPLSGEDIENTYKNASKFTQFVPVWGRPSPFYNLSTDLGGAWGDLFVDHLIRENGMFPLVHMNFYGEGITLVQPPSMPPSTLNTPAWRSLYIQSVKDVVNASRPRYLSLGNEVNRWYEVYGDNAGDDNGFNHFVTLYQDAYDQVKIISPETKVFCTFSREIVAENREADMSVLELFDPARLDLVVLTSYPFALAGTNMVSDIPDDYYSSVFNHISDRPFGFSEVSWTSHEDFGGQREQANFVRNITSRLTIDQGIDLELIGWNWLHDIGPTDLSGLMDNLGNEKTALSAWINNTPPSYRRDKRTIELEEDFGTHEYDLGITFFDPDPWDILSYSIWNGTGYSNVSQNGKVRAEIFGNILNLTSIPNAEGTAQLRMLATDWSGLTNWTLIMVNISGINDPPLGRPMEELVFSEGGAPFFDISYYIYDPDDAFNSLKLEVLEAPELVVSANLSISPYMVLYTDDPEYNGATYVKMRVSDPHGASSIFNLPVRVLPINDPPILKPPTDIVIEEDSSISLNFSGWASDKDDLDLEWNITISDGSNIQLLIENLTLTIVPAENWFGAAVLKVNVSDGEEFDTFDIPITVTPVNDAPIVGEPEEIFIIEDQEYLFNLSELSPYDPDGDTLYWYLDNASHLIRSVAIYDNDTIRIRPLLDGYGIGTFTLRVQDGRGGIARVNFTVNIESVNDAPDFIAPEDWSLDVLMGGYRIVDLRFVPYFVEDVDDPLETLTAVTDYSLAAVEGLVINISVPWDIASESFSMVVEVMDPHGAVSPAHELTIEVKDPDDIDADLEVYNITVSNQDGRVRVTAEGRSGQIMWAVFTDSTGGQAGSYRMTESTKDMGHYMVDVDDPDWEDGEVLYLHLSRTNGGPNESGDLPITFTYRKGSDDVNGSPEDIFPYLIGIASLLLLLAIIGAVLVSRNRKAKVSDFDYGSLLEE